MDLLRYAIYRPCHFIGIFLVLTSIAMLAYRYFGEGLSDEEFKKHKRFVMITHGLGLLLAMLGGMGMMKAQNTSAHGMPVWIVIKMVVWTIFAVAPVTFRFFPKKAKLIFFGYIFLAASAGWLANMFLRYAFLRDLN